MVQELQVLKCCSCETFQSYIVKKKPQWLCKVCGVKQSIKKVYGQGSGKDCRIHTQKLNALRGQKEDDKESVIKEEETNYLTLFDNQNGVCISPKAVVAKASKWTEYLNANKVKSNESGFFSERRLNHVKNVPKNVDLNSKLKRKSCLDYIEVTDTGSSIDSHRRLGNFCSSVPVHDFQTTIKKIKRNCDNAEEQIPERNNVFENINSGREDSTVRNVKHTEQEVKTKISLKWAKYMDEEIEKETSILTFHCKKVNHKFPDINGSKNMGYMANDSKSTQTLLKDNKTSYKGCRKPVEKDMQFPTKQETLDVVPLQKGVIKNNEERLTPSSLPLFEQHLEFVDNDFDLDF